MLIYLRKKYREIHKVDHWRDFVKANMGFIKEKTYYKYFSKIIENLGDKDIKYCIEKGDEQYGAFSYTIAEFCVTNINSEARSAELILFPCDDKEWDEQAKKNAYKIIIRTILSDLELDELFVRVPNTDNQECRLLQEAGFVVNNKKIDDLQEGFQELVAKRIMRFLVTGVTSELGYEVIRELSSRNYDVLGCDTIEDCQNIPTAIPYMALDFTDETCVNEVFKSYNPDAVIHCLSWSAVDDAELEENKEEVYRLNVKATENLAVACRMNNSKMMYLSSDYVFDGEGVEPQSAESIQYNPLNYYGVTKAEGEKAVSSLLNKFFIIRTEWTFGKMSRNFVDLLLDFAKERRQITVVDDQVGVPTYYRDLSILVSDMIITDKYGYYNITNSGEYVSRYEYAKEVFRQAAALGHDEYGENRIIVESVSSNQYKLPKAIRPANSRLDLSKLKKEGFKMLPHWKDALRRYLEEKEF